jgi:hypothetical protein
MIKMKPILFSTPMVKAILEGRKTMTRRIIKGFTAEKNVYGNYNYELKKRGKNNWTAGTNLDAKELSDSFFGIADYCPYGKVGDVLWVRETWCKLVPEHFIDKHFVYKANMCNDTEEIRQDYIKAGYPYKWKPSIFMPKAACRIFLEITDIRVERLQEIGEADAIKEGVSFHKPVPGDGLTIYKNYTSPKTPFYGDNARLSFQTLWQSINGLESWEANPFVWVIEFKQIEKPENFMTKESIIQ